MARFVFLSDTHLGAEAGGYQQQPSYGERLGEILGALDAWIRQQGDIDFVIHGGDMVNAATAETIAAAADMFQLSVPVYLCLGNHDMMGANALDLWTDLAAGLLHGGRPDGRIADQTAVIHILPTHWQDQPYTWDGGEDPHFLDEQLDALHNAIADNKDKTHILVTHSQVLPVPTGQTGLPEPLRGPKECFTEHVLALVAQYPQIRCVLSGHTHINMHVHQNQTHYVTASALVETPFEFKTIRTSADSLELTTVNLIEKVPFRASYDHTATFVQGRGQDRGFIDPQ